MGKKQGKTGGGGTSGTGFSAPTQQRHQGSGTPGGPPTPEETPPEGRDKNLFGFMREWLQKYMASSNNK
jgi:hypothetical protein